MTTDSSRDRSQPGHRAIKSFVLRQGRLTHAQQDALANLWSDYGIDYAEQTLDITGLFDDDNDIVVEIGFGNGDSLLQQAIDQPHYNFLGIEVHSPGVGHLIHNADRQGIRNLKVMRHDAVDVLKLCIPDASIHKLQLFFPDPWHKKRHHKRRIIKPEFISLVHRKLKPGGSFHMATDWQPYAEAMLQQMEAANGFINDSGPGNFSPDKAGRCETKFERRGHRLGHGVWDLVYHKTQHP